MVNNTHVLLTATWRAVGAEENGSGGQGFPSPLQEFKKNLCHQRLPQLALALPARGSLLQPSSCLPQSPAEKACRPEPCSEPRSPTDSLLVSFPFSFQICVRKPLTRFCLLAFSCHILNAAAAVVQMGPGTVHAGSKHWHVPGDAGLTVWKNKEL